MLYSDNIYSSDTFNEHEIHNDIDVIVGKRAKKSKPTPLQISKQNHWNKVKKCRRTIQKNFKPGDLWCTFAYKKGTRKSMDEFIKDMAKFQNLLRAEFQERGYEFKWIRRLEIGKLGGLHAHFIINSLGDNKIISDTWRKAVKESGRAHFEYIDDEDGYEGLARYICKEPGNEVEGQMTFLPPEEKKKLCSISTSRNLERPEREKKKISPWKVMKIVLGKEELTPTEGYFIEQDTVKIGFNKFTHLPYIRYREKKIADSCDYRAQNCKKTAKTQGICHKARIRDQIINKAKGILGSIKNRWKR